MDELLNSLTVTGALREAGIVFKADGDRLRVAPAAKLTPELVALVREHKEQLARIARFREMADAHQADREIVGESGPPVESVNEVFEMARAILNPEGIDYGPPPVPPAPPGRDPMAKPNTEKAKFYRDVRERDLEKRRREGLPPWIRIVDGGKRRDTRGPHRDAAQAKPGGAINPSRLRAYPRERRGALHLVRAWRNPGALDQGAGPRGAGRRRGGEGTMNDRRDKDRRDRKRDREEREEKDQRQVETDRRGRELQEAWRRRRKPSDRGGGAV